MKRFLLICVGLVCSWSLGAQEPSATAPIYTSPFEEGAVEEEESKREAPSGYKPYFLDWSVPNRSCRYEIRIAQGTSSEDFEDIHPSGGYSAWNEFDMAHYELGDEYQYTSPRISVGLSLNRFFQLSISGSVTQFRQNLYNKLSGQPTRSLNKRTIWTNCTARANILNFRHLRTYMGLGLDFGFINESGSREAVTAVCYNMGATCGARVFGFWDISLSSDFMAFTAGVGYRF